MGDMGPKKLMSFEEFALVYDDTGERRVDRTSRQRRAAIPGWRYHG
jgi:hypothetical protein